MKTRLLILATFAVTGLWLYSTGVWLYHGHSTHHYGFWAPPSPAWSGSTSLASLGPMLVLFWLSVRRMRWWARWLLLAIVVVSARIGLPYFYDAAQDFQEFHGVDKNGQPCFWRNPLNRRWCRREQYWHCQECFERYLRAEMEARD